MNGQALATGALFAWCVSAAPLFANVRVEPVHSSSEKVRVIVLHDHAPIKNAKVEILDGNGKPQQIALSTRDDGSANLPRLKPGRYQVVALAEGGLRADLYLDVSRNEKKTTSFSLDLFVAPPPPPSFEERLAAVEKERTVARLADFDGFVKDQSGAAVAQTKVEVFRRGAYTDGRVASASTDVAGAFSLHLSKGSYTAVFSNAGFSLDITAFDIVQDSGGKSLNIVLKVAPATE